MQQANSAIPSALQALMVLKQQAQPVAPGPGGQPIPTVAAQAVQQMAPPQQPAGLDTIAQDARQAAPSVMRNAQDDQAKQMLEAAQRASQPAGIAGLDVPMGGFAEGGVVGFAEGGQATSTLEGLWNWLKALNAESEEYARRNRGARANVAPTTDSPEYTEIPAAAESAPAPASTGATISTTPDKGYGLASPLLKALSGQRGIATPRVAPAAKQETAAPVGIAATAPSAKLDVDQIAAASDRLGLNADPRMEELAREQERVIRNRPDIEGMQLRAQQAAYEREKAYRPWERFFSTNLDPYGGYAKFEKDVQQRDLAYSLLESKTAEAKYLAETGQFDKLMAVQRDIAKIKADFAQAKSPVIGGVAGLQRELMQEQTRAADRASQERVARLQVGAQYRPGENERMIAEYNRILSTQGQAAADRYRDLAKVFKGIEVKEKGLDDRAQARRAENAIAREKLLASDATYQAFDMAYTGLLTKLATKEPTAEELAKLNAMKQRLREIERKKGIIDEDEGAAAPAPASPASAPGAPPSGFKLDK